MASNEEPDTDFLYGNISLSRDVQSTNDPKHDLDLYEDFIVSKDEKKITDHITCLENKLKCCEEEKKSLKERCTSLEKDNKVVLKNMGSVWKTAHAILRNKNTELTAAKKEIDELIFKRAMKQISKDDLDRVVSHIAAYQPEEFTGFLKVLSSEPPQAQKCNCKKFVRTNNVTYKQIKNRVLGRRASRKNTVSYQEMTKLINDIRLSTNKPADAAKWNSGTAHSGKINDDGLGSGEVIHSNFDHRSIRRPPASGSNAVPLGNIGGVSLIKAGPKFSNPETAEIVSGVNKDTVRQTVRMVDNSNNQSGIADDPQPTHFGRSGKSTDILNRITNHRTSPLSRDTSVGRRFKERNRRSYSRLGVHNGRIHSRLERSLQGRNRRSQSIINFRIKKLSGIRDEIRQRNRIDGVGNTRSQKIIESKEAETNSDKVSKNTKDKDDIISKERDIWYLKNDIASSIDGKISTDSYAGKTACDNFKGGDGCTKEREHQYSNEDAGTHSDKCNNLTATNRDSRNSKDRDINSKQQEHRYSADRGTEHLKDREDRNSFERISNTEEREQLNARGNRNSNGRESRNSEEQENKKDSRKSKNCYKTYLKENEQNDLQDRQNRYSKDQVKNSKEREHKDDKNSKYQESTKTRECGSSESKRCDSRNSKDRDNLKSRQREHSNSTDRNSRYSKDRGDRNSKEREKTKSKDKISSNKAEIKTIKEGRNTTSKESDSGNSKGRKSLSSRKRDYSNSKDREYVNSKEIRYSNKMNSRNSRGWEQRNSSSRKRSNIREKDNDNFIPNSRGRKNSNYANRRRPNDDSRNLRRRDKHHSNLPDQPRDRSNSQERQKRNSKCSGRKGRSDKEPKHNRTSPNKRKSARKRRHRSTETRNKPSKRSTRKSPEIEEKIPRNRILTDDEMVVAVKPCMANQDKSQKVSLDKPKIVRSRKRTNVQKEEGELTDSSDSGTGVDDTSIGSHKTSVSCEGAFSATESNVLIKAALPLPNSEMEPNQDKPVSKTESFHLRNSITITEPGIGEDDTSTDAAKKAASFEGAILPRKGNVPVKTDLPLPNKEIEPDQDELPSENKSLPLQNSIMIPDLLDGVVANDISKGCFTQLKHVKSLPRDSVIPSHISCDDSEMSLLNFLGENSPQKISPAKAMVQLSTSEVLRKQKKCPIFPSGNRQFCSPIDPRPKVISPLPKSSETLCSLTFANSELLSPKLWQPTSSCSPITPGTPVNIAASYTPTNKSLLTESAFQTSSTPIVSLHWDKKIRPAPIAKNNSEPINKGSSPLRRPVNKMKKIKFTTLSTDTTIVSDNDEDSQTDFHTYIQKTFTNPDPITSIEDFENSINGSRFNRSAAKGVPKQAMIAVLSSKAVRRVPLITLSRQVTCIASDDECSLDNCHISVNAFGTKTIVPNPQDEDILTPEGCSVVPPALMDDPDVDEHPSLDNSSSSSGSSSDSNSSDSSSGCGSSSSSMSSNDVTCSTCNITGATVSVNNSHITGKDALSCSGNVSSFGAAPNTSFGPVKEGISTSENNSKPAAAQKRSGNLANNLNAGIAPSTAAMPVKELLSTSGNVTSQETGPRKSSRLESKNLSVRDILRGAAQESQLECSFSSVENGQRSKMKDVTREPFQLFKTALLGKQDVVRDCSANRTTSHATDLFDKFRGRKRDSARHKASSIIQREKISRLSLNRSRDKPSKQRFSKRPRSEDGQGFNSNLSWLSHESTSSELPDLERRCIIAEAPVKNNTPVDCSMETNQLLEARIQVDSPDKRLLSTNEMSISFPSDGSNNPKEIETARTSVQADTGQIPEENPVKCIGNNSQQCENMPKYNFTKRMPIRKRKSILGFSENAPVINTTKSVYSSAIAKDIGSRISPSVVESTNQSASSVECNNIIAVNHDSFTNHPLSTGSDSSLKVVETCPKVKPVETLSRKMIVRKRKCNLGPSEEPPAKRSCISSNVLTVDFTHVETDEKGRENSENSSTISNTVTPISIPIEKKIIKIRRRKHKTVFSNYN